MKCENCKAELLTDDTICPACETPVEGAEQSMDAAAETVPSRASNGQPPDQRSIRRGISLTKPIEAFTKTVLYVFFLADVSGSMLGNKWQELFDGLQQMARSLVPLGENCFMGIGEFNESARVAHTFTCPSVRCPP